MKFKNSKERYKKPEENFKNSFVAAIEGLKYSFFEEKNMYVHFFALALVIVAGFLFDISYLEWLIIALVSALVIALELVNTAIEVVIDMVDPQFNPLAKIAKDAAAASVLVMSASALIVGLIIFLPKVLEIL